MTAAAFTLGVRTTCRRFLSLPFFVAASSAGRERREGRRERSKESGDKSRALQGRRGTAVLVVLLMVSVTLAVAYVSMRSATTSSMVQRNSNLRANLRAAARQAAMIGMTSALEKMRTEAWRGVDTTLEQSLGPGQRFEVIYTTGDDSLRPDDPDYSQYPFRVTLLATGYATDSSLLGTEATHRIRAVVRLVPRKLADEPAGWSDITDHTFCQWERGDFSLTLPCRIEGPVRIRSQLDFSKTQLKWSDDARRWYLDGLNTLRLGGSPDWRPFNGPIRLNYSDQRSDTLSLLHTALDLTTEDRSNLSSFRTSVPVSSSTYQLYPGGKAYHIEVLPQELRNDRWQPDPIANPLGIFLRSGTLRVYENVAIRGTVVTLGLSNADLEVYGRNGSILPVDLPPLEHPDATADVPVRLPTLVVSDDLQFNTGSQSTIEGLVLVADAFRVQEASQDETSLSFRGKVAAKNVEIQRRSPWNQSELWWNLQFTWFMMHYNEEHAIRTFPTWLQYVCGLKPQPRIVIRPDADEIRYHWQNTNDPIYVPHPDDGGLRWELPDWTDNPTTEQGEQG